MHLQNFKHFSLVLLTVLASFNAVSQEIEIVQSKPEFNYGSTNLHKVIGHDNENFYIVKFHGNQYHLEKLDKDLNLLLEAPIKLFEGLKTYDLETVVHFHGELYIFVSRRRLNDITLFYQKIDKSNLQAATELIELTNMKFIKGNWADFHFALSRRETKLMVACRIKLHWSKVQFNEYYVLGKNMEVVWKKNDSFEFSGQGPRDNKYIVDEKGNISILSLLKRESILSLFSDIKNVYTIYRYTGNGAYFREYPITLKDRYIRGIKVIGNDKGELVCAGLYSELFRAGVRGTFFFKIHPDDGGIYDNTLNEFDDAMLEQLAESKEPTIEKEELIKYVMTDLVERDNGKIFLIAEQLFEQTFNTYNNLIITCYDTLGQVYWNQVIKKKQDFNINLLEKSEIEPADYRDYVMETGSLDMYLENYCSYALMAPLDENDIYIFFNEDIRNLDNPEKYKNFNRPRKSYILGVRIDEYGNITSQPVIKWKKRALYPEPIRFYDTLGNTIIIPAFKGRKYNYYKITARF
ncbi:MAG: hypothetical protein JXB00_20845 [Bacteroidales bacterium]|nr:hypothetical protein [Bacteroidales bacterium]